MFICSKGDYNFVRDDKEVSQIRKGSKEKT